MIHAVMDIDDEVMDVILQVTLSVTSSWALILIGAHRPDKQFSIL